MKFDKLKSSYNMVKKRLSADAPEILIGLGIFGFCATAVMAAKATPKAIKKIEEKKEELGVEELTVVDTVKVAAPCYIFTVSTGIVSTACILGANSIHAKRHAALATAYQVSVAALSDYKDTVIETIGETKAKEVEEKYAVKKIEEEESKTKYLNSYHEPDQILFFDSISQRTFYSTRADVKEAVADLNNLLTVYSYVSLNDFYDSLDLENTDLGCMLGWNTYRDRKVEIDINDLKWSKDRKPTAIIRFVNPPQYDYDKMNP